MRWAFRSESWWGSEGGKLRLAVALLCLAFCGALWAGVVWQTKLERERIVEIGRKEVHNLAVVLGQHVSKTMNAAELTLRDIGNHYRDFGTAFDLVKYGADHQPLHRTYNSLGIVDASGDLILTSVPTGGKRINFGNTEAFRSLQNLDGPDLHIGTTRAGPVTKKPSIFLSQRLRTPDGAFAGLATVAVRPDYFSGIYDSIDLGPDAVVSVIGRDGIIRIRQSNGEFSAGQDVRGSPLFVTHLAEATGGSYVSRQVDAISRIWGFAALGDYPLIVLVGKSTSHALAGHDRRTVSYVLGAGGATAVVVGLALFAVALIARWERAAEGRRLSDERFALAMNGTNEGMWDWNIASGEDYFSDRWYELLGYARGEIAPGVNIRHEHLHPEDKNRSLAAVRAHLDRREPYDIEYRLRTKGGEYRWFRARGQAIWDAAGRPLRMVGSLCDVTERRRAEQAMRESEEKLRRLVEEAPYCIHELDLDGRFVTVNAAGLAMMRLDDAASVLGTAYVLRAVPDDRGRIEGLLAEAGRGRRSDFEFTTVAGRAVKSNFVPLRGPDGKVTRIFGISVDLTDLRRMAERLNEAQRIAKVGSWELDIVRDELVWSDEIFRIFEIDRDRWGASYESFLEAVHPDDRETVNAAYTASLAARTPYEIVHRLKMADGRIKWVRERCESYFDSAGRPLRSVGTVQDVTDRELAEIRVRELNEHLEERVAVRTKELQAAKEQAEVASRAKSEFLSRVSHELRTPMNAILGFTQVLELAKLAPAHKDYVQEMSRAGNHLLRLIDDLLDLSRVEAGRLGMVIEPVEVREMTEQAGRLVRPLLQQNRIKLLLERDGSDKVLADRGRLRQVVVNLLSNAAKYNRPGGSIGVGWVVRDEALRIRVTDTGAGIPTEKLDDLFKPFERLGQEYGGAEGAGLGLSLSKRLIEMMGGKIGVESAPGRGSTFWVELPRYLGSVREAAGLPPPTVIAPEPSERPLVLHVEDNAASLKVVEALFGHWPHLRLISATTGEFGLELARRYRPGAIVLDIHLPGMDGYDVLKELKADPATRDIPVIALSADAMSIDVEHGLAAGFARYLTKPVKADDLRETVEKALQLQAAG